MSTTLAPLSGTVSGVDTAVPHLIARQQSLGRGVPATLKLDTDAIDLPDRFYYTIHRQNHNGNENHFQGVALSGDDRYLAVSGSNWKEPSGDLFLFRHDMGDASSRPTQGFVRLRLDALLWHAGGIDACGDICAVALEYPHFTRHDPDRFAGRVRPPSHGDGDRSSIRLVEMGAVPRVLPVELRRDGILATCVGITQLLDGRYMLLTLARAKRPEPSDDGTADPGMQVDCYLSSELDPFDIRHRWSAIAPAGLLPPCQSWSLLTDADDGSVVLTVFSGARKGEVVPFIVGGPEQRPAAWQRLDPIPVDVDPGDFRAGGTLAFVGGELRLLAVDRYRDTRTRTLPVAELAWPERMAAPVAAAGVPELVTRAAGKPKRRRLVALRDTLDFRDLMYVPTLIEVPPRRPLGEYLRGPRIDVLDQGETSACTGYALATVIHYQLRRRRNPKQRVTECVSTEMLYAMAKRYDEWSGEKYDGSSCRGAMKAWHKHGACLEKYWPDRMDPHGWDDARRRPLGAYFRVNHRDLIAMHAAISEVGILYASAIVHSGWDDVGADGRIEFREDKAGGHAFAIVAYEEDGFWIQNSWGDEWGRKGFALLSYDDWLENGMDVWVARIGAPVNVGRSSTAVGMEPASRGSRSYFFSDLRPHVISTGNDGRLRTSGTYGTSASDVNRILGPELEQRTRSWSQRRLLLYAHGGLVSEDAALQRLADYLEPFTSSEIYPISFIWKTDLWTTVTNIVKDAVRRRRPEGPLDRLKDFMLDRLDDALEPIARSAGGPAIWGEMKENAERTVTDDRGAFRLIAPLLRDLAAGTQLHIVAHSAGSIYFARLVQWLTAPRSARVLGMNGLETPIDSVTLWAPAITLRLFRATYMPAIRSGMIRRFTLFTLDDQTERADHCGHIYNKSLLYLVSNALEARARGPRGEAGEPLLGLERSLREEGADIVELAEQGHIEWILAPTKSDPVESESEAHGAFDDDTATVRSTLRRILPAGAQIPDITFARTASSRRERRNLLDDLSA